MKNLIGREHSINSLWTWHDKCNICCRYCIYHVKFNVCLVTKPLGVFFLRNKMTERFASFSEDELCEKCTIKLLLNSVFAWYHELSKPRVCVICLSLRLRQITQTSVLIICSTSSSNCLIALHCSLNESVTTRIITWVATLRTCPKSGIAFDGERKKGMS